MVNRIKYGNTNTFFISGTNGNLLVDTDYAGTLPLFYKEIKKNNIKLSDIIYVLATHYHPDHIGLVSELMEKDIKLLLVNTQLEYVHFSDEIFNRDKRIKYTPINENEAVLVSCEESRAFLRSLGIDGEILSTPSHSNDSISLILDDGSCFVGDLEPMEYLDAYNENTKAKDDWKLVISHNPRMIFYAHANEKALTAT